MAKKQPDLKKLRTEKRPRSEKYFDTTQYPIFEGTDKEYLALVKKHIKTKEMTTEEFAKRFGTLRKPLDPAKYPNVDITPEMVEEGDLFTSRSSKPTQSAYETSNTKNRRARSMEMQSITTDQAGEFEYHTFQDGVAGNADQLGEGRALHHKRGINQFRPFFEGLNQDETIELANWFKQEGYAVGNHFENLIALTENAKDAERLGLTSEPILHQGPGSIHNWQSDVNVEPLNTHPLYKKLVAEMADDKGKPLSVAKRLPFIMDYLEKVQDPIENKLGQVGSYEQLRDFQNSIGRIKTGPRAGQRLPVNRATLAEKIIKDIRETKVTGGVAKFVKNPAVRRAAALAPFVGTLIGAGTVEANAASRDEEIAANPNAPTLHVNKSLDQVSGWGDRTSLAGMAATATGAGAPVGIPTTAVGELTSLGAGLASMAIDATRGTINLIRNPEKIKELKPANMEFTTM